MKLGYQQTEIGVLPDDWNLALLGELGSVVRGGSPRPAGDPRYFNGSHIPWLTVGSLTNIPSSQLFVTDTTTMLTEEGAKHSRTLQEGTLVIVNSGAKTLGVAKILSITCCANDGIAALINQRSGDKRFICYFLDGQIRRLREVVAAGNDQLNLNTGRIALIAIPFPSEVEQSAIAEALSDVDALLGALDRLIAKKRDLKQAAMQQLLTGQKRLPGFQGDWKVKRLGDVLTICHGRSQKEVQVEHGPYPILATGGQIGTANQYLYDKPSVLIGRKGTIDQPQYMDTPFWTVDTLFYSALQDSNNAKFFFYQFCLIDWKRYNEASGVPSLNASTIENITVLCPDTAEQAAIAALLSEMDTELASLEQRRDKTRALKQGMTQELLTGRTRLVSPESAHA
jgi:type I restriction enzyme, S subunit